MMLVQVAIYTNISSGADLRKIANMPLVERLLYTIRYLYVRISRHDRRSEEFWEKAAMVLSKINKSIATALAVMSFGTMFCASSVASTAQAQEVTLDSSVAVVNSDIILRSELDAAQKAAQAQFKSRGANVDAVTARRAALEQLVTRSIIVQIGKRYGISLTDTQIDQALAQTAARSNTSVNDILKSFGNVDLATARQKFAEEFVINEVRTNQVRRRVRISDAEVELLAKNLRKIGNVEPSYHLGQIILGLDANASYNEVNRVTSIANTIKSQASKGADFNALAAQYAQGSNAVQGGDIGFVPESQVPVPFLPAILKANPGAVIGPIRSPFGLHLIKLYEVTNQAVEPVTTYKAKHILLKTSIIFYDEAAVNELNALRNKIVSGGISFAQAAKKYSEDTGSASLGGELGYAPAGRYDPGFAQGLVALRVGEVSQPIKSSFGWHLIYLEDRKIDKDSDEAYEARARELIFRRLFNEESAAWEREIRATAHIRVTDPILVNAGMADNANIEGDPALHKSK